MTQEDDVAERFTLVDIDSLYDGIGVALLDPSQLAGLVDDDDARPVVVVAVLNDPPPLGPGGVHSAWVGHLQSVVDMFNEALEEHGLTIRLNVGPSQ